RNLLPTPTQAGSSWLRARCQLVLVLPGKGRDVISLPEERAGLGSPGFCWRCPRQEFPELCQASIPVSYLLHLPGVLLRSWAEPRARPAQSFLVLCHQPGQQGFPHGVPGRAGVPTWAQSHPPFPGKRAEQSLLVLFPLSQGVTHQQWYLFNDFLIEPVDKCEAVQFDMSWKVPAILYYARRNLNSKYNLVIKNPIEASVLLAEASLARKQRKCHATFIPLMLNEMPQAGDLVGLDAEFVTLNEEEAELRSDGTKSTIKPSQMSVARITCVRGQGPNEGVPFIDDYISTQEQVWGPTWVHTALQATRRDMGLLCR
uniref:Uncharacterized protein n=1 Tax=Junco hyemalis TaxID=40217 RepID=A0A8C5IRC3_JUNHY